MSKYMRKSYGPPRRSNKSNASSTKLESLENFKNKLLLNEYTESITHHLKNIEQQSQINPAMIDLQPEVKWYMRPFLVNFIIQMHSSLKLKPQTLFLCWNIIDKYCAKRIAFKQHYQLIGCTALWIAAKYEDKKSRVPTVKELNSMCSNVYDDSMFREMEVHILSTLNWSLSYTNLEDILQLSIKFSDPDGKETLAKPLEYYKGNTPTVSAILAVSRYLCELTLYEKEFMNFTTSLIGSTCFLMACSILNMDYGSTFLSNIYNNFETSMNHSQFFKDFVFEQNEGESDESFFIEDTENIEPQFINFGPFIQGFHGQETISQIRNIAINLFKSILNPSEVLVEKYQALGVMTVVGRFIDENDLTNIDLQLFQEQQQQKQQQPDVAASSNAYVVEFTNLLLSFSESASFNSTKTTSPGPSAPLSSTSADSLFCTTPACDSPSNFSSFSSVSSATSYNSDFADLKETLI